MRVVEICQQSAQIVRQYRYKHRSWCCLGLVEEWKLVSPEPKSYLFTHPVLALQAQRFTVRAILGDPRLLRHLGHFTCDGEKEQK